MKIKDKIKLSELNGLVGKLATYRTSRGKSLPHIIESIEITDEKVMFILRQKHKSFTKRREARNVELVKIKDNRAYEQKIKRAEIIEDRKTKKEEKEEKKEEKLKKLIEKTDELNRISIQTEIDRANDQEY